MCVLKPVPYYFNKNNNIFHESVVSVFTDASKLENKNQYVMGGLFVYVNKTKRVRNEMVPLGSTGNDNMDKIELAAIYHMMKNVTSDFEIINSNTIKQINLYCDNLNAVNALRYSLISVNKMLTRNYQEREVAYECPEELRNIALYIHKMVASIRKPLYVFHIKAHQLRNGKININNFVESFAVENFGFQISGNDAKILMYYNDYVDKQVSSINRKWNFGEVIDYQTEVEQSYKLINNE